MTRVRLIGAAAAAVAIFAIGIGVGTALPSFELEGVFDHTDDHGHQHTAHGGHSHDDGHSHRHGADDHDHADEEDDHKHEEDDHTHEDVVALAPKTIQTLDLKESSVQLQDVWRSLRIPATIVEKPGQSEHSLASPVNGIVQQLTVVSGQAVSPGDELFRLRVTDEALSQAQVDLLKAITKMDVIDAELERLEPLIRSGTVSGQRKRELGYERQQLDAQRQLHMQELLMRGLDDAQVEAIAESRELLRDFVIRFPGHGHGRAAHENHEGPDYSIESVLARPGTTVKRGDDVCRMAYHAELYLTGSAFENELDAIVKAADARKEITATFGTLGAEYRREGLIIEYIDNHVDEQSQTFSFYIPLENEVVRDVKNEDGVRFRTWRFKPGQRAQLSVPIEEFADHIRLPLAAIVRDGIHVYVFRRLDHSHGDEVEYQRVPVQIAYQDEQYAVLRNDGALQVGQKVIANRAYELNLELKADEGGGGGHGHVH